MSDSNSIPTRLSEVPLGTTFFGEVTSLRNEKAVYRGVFAKLANDNWVVLENPEPYPHDTSQPFTREMLRQDPPYTRFIHPNIVVWILWTTEDLPADRFPMILDDLELRDYASVDVKLNFNTSEEKIVKEIRLAEILRDLKKVEPK